MTREAIVGVRRAVQEDVGEWESGRADGSEDVFQTTGELRRGVFRDKVTIMIRFITRARIGLM